MTSSRSIHNEAVCIRGAQLDRFRRPFQNYVSLYGRAKLISGDGGSVTQLMLIEGL